MSSKHNYKAHKVPFFSTGHLPPKISVHATVPDHCLDYDKVKAAVLRVYELVPEAYRQKFRKFRKSEHQTYCEFGCKKETV